MKQTITKVAVIGAGIMGHGIAQVCAQSGKQVALVDLDPGILRIAEKKIFEHIELLVRNKLIAETAGETVANNIRFTTDIREAVREVDIIIEAIPEKPALKSQLYSLLDEYCHPETIIASNTSGIPINRLAKMTKRPEKFIGAHFYMPAQLVPLVEVIQGEKTAETVVETVMTLMEEIGKKPVHVRKDIPGFIGNRLQHALAREAMSLVQKGVATPEDIDTVVKTSLAIRLIFTGPLEQRDFNGLDTHMSIAEYLYPDLEDSQTPLPILKEKVDAGHLGLKTGKGFYDWSERSATEVINHKNQQLVDLLTYLDSKKEI